MVVGTSGRFALAFACAFTFACAATTASCGRYAFVALDASEDNDASEGAGDAQAPRPCDWSNGPQFRTAPVQRTDLNSPAPDLDPYLVPDNPLRIFLASERAGEFDIYTATRSSLDAPFSTPTPVPNFSLPVEDERSFNVEAGEATGHVSLDGVPYEVVMTNGTYTLGRRVTEIEVGTVTNDAVSYFGGAVLTFTSGPDPLSSTIYFASRAARSEPWSNIEPFPFDVAGVEGGATMTADGLVMVWAGLGQNLDIFYATRTSRDLPFTNPQPLIASPAHEHEPVIRGDGCELFFAQGQPQDLYSVELLP